MIDDTRPSPDSFLTLADQEEKKAKRGKLKIFFGSSAGVGKTYNMLSAAQEMLKKGTHVVIGIVETHKRPNTELLKEGLEAIKPIQVPYRGLLIPELDLDKALELRPHTILVDELAHTNTPGCRHPKRWNDVMELLDAGINVMTTLNVQHIESLSDLVAGSTGIWVKETVPDSVFDMADDIVLVDIDTDDLLKRLQEGNVYIAPDANRRAAENFFKKENLNALRQLALRRTAERVDAEHDLLAHGIARAPVSDKILVCVGPITHSAKLIRSAKRMAMALKAPWTALYVETGDPESRRNQEFRRSIELFERMVNRLDGTMMTIHGSDIHDEIISYARKNKITKIIIGKDSHFTLRNFFEGVLVNRIIKSSGNIDVIVITEEDDAQDMQPCCASMLTGLKPFYYLLTLLMVVSFSVPGLFMSNLITGTDQALLYLAGIVLVAENFGLGPAMFYALLAASTFVGLFTDEHYFRETDTHAYLTTFIVMLITGYSIAKQSAKLKAQAISSRIREDRTRSLYELTKKLTAARGRFPVADIMASYLTKIYNVKVSIWITGQDGRPSAIIGELPETSYYKDLGALQWCLDNGKNAGHGTDTMPSATGFYLPLTTSAETIGAIGLYPEPEDKLFTFDEVSSMETLASLLSSALDRVRSGEIAQQALIENENKKVRESLLSAFGDSLQTTTKSVETSIANLLREPGAMPKIEITPPKDSAEPSSPTPTSYKLNHFVDMRSIESGSVQTNKTPCSILNLVQTSLERIQPAAQKYDVVFHIPDEIPDVLVDATLTTQLFMHILENAVRFSPESSKITITAQRYEGDVEISIEDEGCGFPDGMEKKIFDKFYALSDLQNNKSFGLGLTIASGIVRLQGGKIWAENRPNGGAKISFTLPLA
ncbi:MAG: ATP-binding protein [Bdellovibrionales bacterium]